MNLASQQSTEAPKRRSHGILYGMLLLAVLVSLPLGIVVAGIGAWFSIQGGSLLYLPVGLVVLLTGLAIVHRHLITDLFLLAILAIIAIAWWTPGSDAKSWMLNLIAELSGRIELLFGSLTIMLIALAAIYWYRYRTVSVSVSVR